MLALYGSEPASTSSDLKIFTVPCFAAPSAHGLKSTRWGNQPFQEDGGPRQPVIGIDLHTGGLLFGPLRVATENNVYVCVTIFKRSFCSGQIGKPSIQPSAEFSL
jgi:hypothetical protein